MKAVKTLIIALTSMVLTPIQAVAEDYVIDLGHTFIEFKVSHLGYSYILGRFNKFDGKFNYDEENPSATTFEVTIDVASLDSNHAERDKHLRGAKYLDTKSFPESTFKLTKFEENPDGTFTATGDFTLSGKTGSVTVEGQHIGDGKDPWGGYRRGFEGNTVFDAADYGLPDHVGDVEIYMVVEGIRQ